MKNKLLIILTTTMAIIFFIIMILIQSWPILLPVLLLGFGYWKIALVALVVPTMINTLRFYSTDIFSDEMDIDQVKLFRQIMVSSERKEIIQDLRSQEPAQRDDFYQFMMGTSNRIEYTLPIQSRSFLTLLYAPHTCKANPMVRISDDKEITATITHLSWNNYWLLRTGTFHIVFQRSNAHL